MSGRSACGAKRWVAFARACALVGLAAVTGAAAPPPGFADAILQLHNRERAAVGVAPLAWDDRLAAQAAGWAARLAATDALQHSPDLDGAAPEGENLWAGTHGYYAVAAMVGLWAQEKRNFVFRPIPDASRTGNFEDVGHYTQMVWRGTRRIGCALASGRDSDFLVCRYATGGNMVGEAPF